MACFRAFRRGVSPGQAAAGIVVWLVYSAVGSGFASAQSVGRRQVAPTPTASVLQDVRHWSTNEATRIALETSVEAEFTHGALHNPERVFVDLMDTRPKREFRGLAYSVPVGDARVRQIRVALNSRGMTRVAIDLNGPAEFSVTRLTLPERVVVEIRAAGAHPSPKPSATPELLPPPGNSDRAPAVEPEPKVTRRAPKPFVPPASKPKKAESPAPALFAFTSEVPSLSGVAAKVPSAPGFRDLDEPAPLVEPTLANANPPATTRAAKTPETTEDDLLPTKTARIAPRTEVPRRVSGRPDGEDPVPAPAQRDRMGNRSLTRVLGLKLNRIVIDPGHGGQDQGTSSRGGLLEKDLVLDVGLRLGKMLEDQLGVEVVYTRKDDTFIPLEKRTQIANQHKADLFLSIHANSSPYPAISGVETYYLSLAAPREDLELAARENAGAQRSIGELSEVIRKIALADKVDESREFASRVQNTSYDLVAKTSGRQVRNRGTKKAPFVVLIGAEMPSVLTEIGFLSNPREEGLMKKAEHRQKIAEALYKGIVGYEQSLSHFRVARRDD